QGGAASGPLAALPTEVNIEPRGAISRIVDNAAIERHILRKAFRIRGTSLESTAHAQRCFDMSRASYKCGTRACCAVLERTGRLRVCAYRAIRVRAQSGPRAIRVRAQSASARSIPGPATGLHCGER